MTNRLTPIVAGLLLLGTYASLADDLEEFLDNTGSLSISTESAGQPNRVEGRIFAPVAPNGFNTANYFIDLSAFINAGSNDITEYHDDAGELGGSARIGYRQLNEKGDWIHGIHAAYSTRRMDGDIYQIVTVGVEALSDDLDFRLTGTLPIGTTWHVIENTIHAGTTLGGGEFAVTKHMTDRLSGTGSVYYWSGDHGYQSEGWSIGATYQINNPFSCSVLVSDDDLFDTRYSASINYKIEFGKPKTSSADITKSQRLLQRLFQSSGLETAVIRIKDPIILGHKNHTNLLLDYSLPNNSYCADDRNCMSGNCHLAPWSGPATSCCTGSACDWDESSCGTCTGDENWSIPRRCRFPSYRYEESPTSRNDYLCYNCMGSKCYNDCDCDGARTCNPNDCPNDGLLCYCKGTAR